MGACEVANLRLFKPLNRSEEEQAVAKITFIQSSGEETTVDAPTGTSVMNAAIDNLVPGIDADCGGECSCATCHVLVTQEWLDKVGAGSEQEN